MAKVAIDPHNLHVPFRLQRTTVESAFVSIQATEDSWITEPDGSGRLNVEKLVERALEMGRQGAVSWEVESQNVQLHPVQMPPPWSQKDKN
jgi:hypothetical protein